MDAWLAAKSVRILIVEIFSSKQDETEIPHGSRKRVKQKKEEPQWTLLFKINENRTQR